MTNLLKKLLVRFKIDPEKLEHSFNKIKYPTLSLRYSPNKKIISAFAELFYDQGRLGGTWNNTKWLGTRTMKFPSDLWVYQEIIFETKPDVIIETGTAFGGSALFLASILDLLGKGKVVTCDIYKQKRIPKHERIKYLVGSSTSKKVFDAIKSEIKKGDRVMVILDSDHRKEHVLSELVLYSPLVSVGQYLIVEDTAVNGHPIYKSHGPGPFEAVMEFMKQEKKFVVDNSREKYLVTSNPSGYLKKVR